MKYAITPGAVGAPPLSVRAVKPEWSLDALETFTTDVVPIGWVLAEDRVSLRPPNEQERAAAAAAKQIEAVNERIRHDILAEYPLTTQMNLLRGAFENLVEQVKAAGVALDERPWQDARAAWAAIDAKRQAAEAEEGDIRK